MKATYYHDDIEYIESHFRIIDTLIDYKENSSDSDDSEKKSKALRKLRAKIRKQWRSIRIRREHSLRQKRIFGLDRLADRHQLNSFERQIVIFLLYKYLTTDTCSISGRSILETLTYDRVQMMRARNSLRQLGRLRKNGIICSDDTDEEDSVFSMEFYIPEEIIGELLGENRKTKRQPVDKNYKTYLQLWFSLAHYAEKQAEIVNTLRQEGGDSLHGLWGEDHFPGTQELRKIRRNIRRIRRLIDEFDPLRENFPLEKVAKEHNLSADEKLIMVILLRDSLGLSDMFMGCEGKKLLAIISETEKDLFSNRSLLYKNCRLRLNNLIHTEKVWSGQNILESEYFLSEKMIRRLLAGVSPEADLHDEESQDYEDDGRLLTNIQPRISFADVVLPKASKETIEVTLSQLQHNELIFKTWGFEQKIPYGRALTMLFSGPPGTGKTMVAEAIASSLGKKLLIANYSQIQNLYVGETEKRIVSAFKTAREENGVLLWDEADAMFYSREMASQSWECRDVNIILQELEKFEGVVVLTTNRKIALDKALSRRISLKLDFDMPDEAARKAIWRSHLPDKVPLMGDVDFDHLAREYPIAGGIIKNAVLHAARYAAYARADGISMSDLVRGIEMEMNGGWGNSKDRQIGFK